MLQTGETLFVNPCGTFRDTFPVRIIQEKIHQVTEFRHLFHQDRGIIPAAEHVEPPRSASGNDLTAEIHPQMFHSFRLGIRSQPDRHPVLIVRTGAGMAVRQKTGVAGPGIIFGEKEFSVSFQRFQRQHVRPVHARDLTGHIRHRGA